MAKATMKRIMVYLVVVLMVVELGVASKADVNIWNNIAPGEYLYVRCASGDTNLGEHNLAFGQKWGFGFSPNLWGTTLFHCDFGWRTHSQGLQVWKAGFPGACLHCEWRVSQLGFYRNERGKSPVFVTGWK